ncbi:MAG: bifunctional phosphoribosyl-AMP cyclohydrolase/phosphoribosyl-ATP pyrophosphatase [Epulopiscium sp. Nuni2H_MBin003]|nr:MAG: bifunctional phosphoribosyl-AMP cyclohydrolase/phosphoribosyl-ATP pyrophosphatase [Epulopiscium sp. Nuni2H_MBin003]
MNNLNFDSNGLIPAVVQDFQSREVLMLAYMNEESIRITQEEGYTCFYSRSRKEIWRKGETSGHIQKVIRMSSDCDNDTILIEVEQTGVACHTGAPNCFFNTIIDEGKTPFSIAQLEDMIQKRKETKVENSYTTYLFEKGKEKILKKVGEESAEVIIGAMQDDKNETIYEIADLTYHVLVLMVEMDISVNEVKQELSRRHIIDKKVKQEKMV